MLEDGLARVDVDDAHGAVALELEGLVVRAVLLRLMKLIIYVYSLACGGR